MHVTAAVVACVLLVALGAVQLAVALGAPWGRFVWGGQHDGILPRHLRISSAVVIGVYVVFAVLLLDRAGVVDLLPEGFSRVAAWVLCGYLALGTVQNGISRSRPERLVMTPTTLALAVCALLVALA